MTLAAEKKPTLPPEEKHLHIDPTTLVTEDAVLKEQILKVNEALEQLHQKMAEKRRTLQAATSDAQKATLYAELDRLRKEHDPLEDLLHELVNEAMATEWTKIDEALRRVRELERTQEQTHRQEEVLRDRQP